MYFKKSAFVLILTLIAVYLHAQTPGTLKWTFTPECELGSPPSIGPDGTIFIGTYSYPNNNFYALRPDGSIKWEFEVSGVIKEPPAIGSDGKIYLGVQTPYPIQTDNKLIVFNAGGTALWEYDTPNDVTAPAIDTFGNLYFCSGDTLYALDNSGSEIWKFKLSGSGKSPVMGPDETIYVCAKHSTGYSPFRTLYAINKNGTEKWQFEKNHSIVGWPAIDRSGTIYICYQGRYTYSTSDHKLYALNPDGTEKWSVSAGDMIWTGPSIGLNGTIYFCDYDRILYAIDSTGNTKWTLDKGFGTVPAIGTNGVLYIGAGINGYFWAINPDGTIKWQIKKGDSYYSDPAIGRDGTIYVRNDRDDYGLCAIACEAYGLAQSPWPKTRGGNMYRGRPDDPPPPNDIGIVSIEMDSIAQLNNAQNVKVWLYNFGSETQSNFQLGYQTDNSTPVVENYANSISPNELAEYTFPTSWLPDQIGYFEITVFINLVGDENTANDTLRKTIKVVYQNDVGISEIQVPSHVGINRPVTVSIELTNDGVESQSNFPVSYKIGLGNWITENYSSTIATQQKVVYSFSETWTPTSLTSYLISVKTSLNGDQNTNNDNKQKNITVVNAAYMGTWVGTTSQNSRPLFFKVNGEDQIDSISVEIRVNFGVASCTYLFSNTNLIPIENDTFRVEVFGDIFIPSGEDYPIVHGAFTNEETCEGTISKFKAAGGYCGGNLIIGTGYTNSSKTWNANRTSWSRIVVEKVETTPNNYQLSQNYPNPFNPLTTIEYQLPKKTHVSLKVFDIRGRGVLTLVNGEQPQGHYKIQFDSHNLPSGTYFYQLKADHQILCKRMVILK